MLTIIRPLLITSRHPENIDSDFQRSNTSTIAVNQSEDLRMNIIAFLYSFVDEGIEEIKKQDGSFHKR